MTILDTHAVGSDPSLSGTAAGAAGAPAALSGIVGWITTTDHKRIGRLLMGGGLVGLVGITVLGALLGIERASTSEGIVDAGSLPQLFAAYRLGLIFVVLVPIVLGLAVAVVPLQLGAPSLAFPRLAAAGFWSWLVGAVLVLGTILANGGPSGGNRRMVAGFMLAHIVLLIGLTAIAVSVATSVLTTRAPGMNMRRVPPFSFAALVASLGLVMVLPVLVGTLTYAYVDYRYGGTGFGLSRDLFTHIGFGSTQPATFVYALLAFGILAEVAAVASGRRLPMRGVIFTGFGLLGLFVLGGVIQVPAGVRGNVLDASFGTALGDFVPYALFNLLPLLGGLVVLGTVGLALRSAKPKLMAPLVFALLGCLMVLTGMVGNALYLIGDAQLTGTVFEEGTRVYVGYGAVLAVFGGIAYWSPKLWGRSLPDKAILPLALLGFLGTVLASLPYYVAGFAKQPADSSVFDYGGPEQLWNIAAAAGHLLMLLTVLAFVGLVLKTFTGTTGDPSGDDPWDGQTLEWATSSPAPYANFAEIHTVTSAEPLLDLKQNAAGSTT